MSIFQSPLFERIAERTPFSYAELATLILTAPQRYKEHTIAKRRGGTRLIAQPTKEIKFLQRLLVSTELNGLRVSPAATAYVKGKSIHDHAALHASNRYLLKLDFLNFFPSITHLTIRRTLLSQLAFNEEECQIIERILLRAPRGEATLRLSIGAPSSPFISNCVLYEFDEDLIRYCAASGLVYSRYADDIAISTDIPHVLDDAKKFVAHLLRQHSYLGLSLHPEKTVNVSTKNRRSLTGLILSNNGGASVGREKKRLLRAQVYSMVNGKLHSIELESLKGYLSWVKDIDPTFIETLATRHGLTVKQLLNYSPDQSRVSF